MKKQNFSKLRTKFLNPKNEVKKTIDYACGGTVKPKFEDGGRVTKPMKGYDPRTLDEKNLEYFQRLLKERNAIANTDMENTKYKAMILANKDEDIKNIANKISPETITKLKESSSPSSTGSSGYFKKLANISKGGSKIIAPLGIGLGLASGDVSAAIPIIGGSEDVGTGSDIVQGPTFSEQEKLRKLLESQPINNRINIQPKFYKGGIVSNEEQLGQNISSDLDPKYNVSEQFKAFRPRPEYQNLSDDELIKHIIASNKMEQEENLKKEKNKSLSPYNYENGGVVYNEDPIRSQLEKLAMEKIQNYAKGGIAKPESAPSLKPPKEWFREMSSDIKKGNPDYSKEQIGATIGNIWYNQMGRNKREELREREGKTYGKAPEMRFGGVVQDNGMNYVGDNVDANVNEGEAVVNLESQQRLMDALQGKVPFESLKNANPIVRPSTPEETNLSQKQKEQELRLSAIEDILLKLGKK